MYTHIDVHSTIYGVHYTVYTVQYTVYTVHCTLYTIHSTLYGNGIANTITMYTMYKKSILVKTYTFYSTTYSVLREQWEVMKCTRSHSSANYTTVVANYTTVVANYTTVVANYI